ncbi:MAG: OmpA family protein [Lacipirellulaceae bacterium]
MTRPALACCLALLLPLAVGCGRVVFKPSQTEQQPLSITPQQQQLLAQQQTDLQQRATRLDTDNQELESLLAQSRQQVQLLNDQVAATQTQLKATAERLAATQNDNTDLRTRTEALVASSRAPIGGPFAASMRPNSTLLRPLTLSESSGVEVRQDGDVIRVAVSSDQLFYTSAAQLQPTGERLVERVARELFAAYPGHLLGIEGHTDGAPVTSAQFPTSHHLSVAQATSVYDVLRRGGAPSQQLFVIGHGANHPLVSNATEAGRQKNRRIELVVYPETVGR